tara:strand:- start:712 stop:1230 length:519 start_codon:yes stop_codon:yes gene_type:complete
MDHDAILKEALRVAKNKEDIPLIETLHQNISHMTVSLKEVETRMLRVVGKLNRLNISDTETFLLPLAESVSTLKLSIQKTQKSIDEFYNKSIYTVDLSIDSSKEEQDCDGRKIIRNLSCDEVKRMINEYSIKYGKPKFISGVVLWIFNKTTYCFSVYKNDEPLDLRSIDDLT